MAKMCQLKTQKVCVLSQSESKYESETGQTGEVFLSSGKRFNEKETHNFPVYI